MISSVFYLSSHDLGNDILPRKCTMVNTARGRRTDSVYLLVECCPPIESQLLVGHGHKFNRIVLAPVGEYVNRDLLESNDMVEIVVCPGFSEVIDENSCAKIGTGRVHSTWEEALASSPISTGRFWSGGVDTLIRNFAQEQSDSSLWQLRFAFLSERVVVPVWEVPDLQSEKEIRIPVICIHNSAGEGAIPAFTAMEHLLAWKPAGCDYVMMPGRKLIQMANSMPDIMEIVVNPFDLPRGWIPRREFAEWLALGAE